MDTPYIKIGVVANLFSRQMHFKKAGDTEAGHTHPFDHLTLLAAGGLRVTVNGKSSEFKAPHMIYIKAEHNHELVALEDDTIAYCIHALRTGEREEDILDPAMVPAGVNPMTLSLPLARPK
jgi:quercetin dioxygenase-like cupin family protein